MPIAGGNYLRQLPEHLMQTAVGQWLKKESSPFVMYFQVWELDADQPRLSVTSRLARLRHYRNLGLYRTLLPRYLQATKFTSIAEHSKLAASPLSSLHQQSAPAFVSRLRSETSLRWSSSQKIAVQDGAIQPPGHTKRAHGLGYRFPKGQIWLHRRAHVAAHPDLQGEREHRGTGAIARVENLHGHDDGL